MSLNIIKTIFMPKTALLEAILFTTEKPLSAEDIQKIVKSEYVDKVSHLTPHADLSRGLLRVLSIISYHEPVSQSDIVKVVGNRTYEYVKELESRGLVKSEKKSRTRMLS